MKLSIKVLLRPAWVGLALALVLTLPLGGVPKPKPVGPPPGTAGVESKPPPGAPAALPKKMPGPPRLAPRVLLLSLDGVSAEELRQLHRDELLDEGGFTRFFQEGVVAESLVPANPTLTAPNHISLATGYAADRTGIVGNRFHPAGAPFAEEARGFSFPIATETLWEAARRQKKRAGVLSWPGADDTGPRRRGDWGMTYAATPDHEARLLAFSRGDWQPASSKFASSRSPLLAAHVTLGGAGGTGAAAFDLFAIDRSDDGKENYDGLIMAANPKGDLLATEPLRQGEWGKVAFRDSHGPSACWVKVLALDPDLKAVRLYFGATYHLPAYPAGFAGELAQAGLAWPGPPDDSRLVAGWNGEEGIDLDTWVEQSEHFAEFFGDVLRLAAQRSDWDLLLGYFPVIDEAGHRLLLTDPRQPGFSPERRDTLAKARRRVWQAVDRELRRLVGGIDLARTTVVVVSDHGMAPVHTEINLDALLRERGLAAAAHASGDGGMAHLYLASPAGADPAARERTLADLRTRLAGWQVGGEAPIERVLTRHEAAALGLDHPNSGDLILLARDGFAFDSGGDRAAGLTHPAVVYGMHGYPATNPHMAAIYMAIGKGIKPAASGPVQCIEVAARIAAWLGIEKPLPTPPAEAADRPRR
ncbi:MAG TPA: alkaline phosphatase family protein [Thermoanaerobaculia bacterium]|nr:alkaline phosphatase family protein [Thermoanaerobaculia bacterium]